MKAKLQPLFATFLLGLSSLTNQAHVATEAGVQRYDWAHWTNSPATPPIPWNEIGAKAGADYSGDGLRIWAEGEGARLRCVFQRMEGEATPEGLWLTSTVQGRPADRFRVVATAVGRERSARLRPALNVEVESLPPETFNLKLSTRGNVAVGEKLVRFSRPGLVEEYTVSMDGVRQDFVVLDKPAIHHPPSARLHCGWNFP
jgi:hypothetical protein